MTTTAEGDPVTDSDNDLLLMWFPTIAEVADLQRLDAVGYGNRSLSRQKWARLLQKPTTLTLALGKTYLHPISFVVLDVHERKPTTADLLRLCVAPEERGHGVGRLMVEMMGETHQLNLQLRERSEAALAFAKAVGFRAVGVERLAFEDCDGIKLQRPATVAIQPNL